MAPSRRKGVSKAAAAAAARRQWKVGDLVLAKVKGFPAWPATVSEPEKWGYSSDWKKVLVYFFGTKQIAFCNPADVEEFTEEKKQSLLGKRHGRSADFVRALQEIVDCYEKLKENNQYDQLTSVDCPAAENAEACDLNESNTTVPDKAHNARVKSSNSPRTKDEPCLAVDDGGALTEVEYLHPRGASDELPDTSIPPNVPNTYSSRKKLRSIQQQRHVNQNKVSDQRSRSSSRLDSHGLQDKALIYCNGKSSGDGSINGFWDGPLRRAKRSKRSPDLSVPSTGDSPICHSNGTVEDNGSEVAMADSETLSNNEGNVIESNNKHEQFETPNENCEGGLDLSKRLDLHAKSAIVRKKRNPGRKRATNDGMESTSRCDQEVNVDLGNQKDTLVLPTTCPNMLDSHPKDEGDEHLPLVKRARVRLGKLLSEEQDQLDFLVKSEEKPLEPISSSPLMEACASLDGNDVHPEKNSLPVNRSLVCSPVDNCTQVSENKSPPSKAYSFVVNEPAACSVLNNCAQVPENKPQPWKAKTSQPSGCAFDGEAALPPSKRLHRALEAMSANVDEETHTSPKTDNEGFHLPFSESCSNVAVEDEVGNNMEVQNETLNRNNALCNDDCSGAANSSNPVICEVIIKSSGESFEDNAMMVDVCKDNKDHIGLESSRASENVLQGQASRAMLESVCNVLTELPLEVRDEEENRGVAENDKPERVMNYVMGTNPVSVEEEVVDVGCHDRTSEDLCDNEARCCAPIESVKTSVDESTQVTSVCEAVEEVKHYAIDVNMGASLLPVLNMSASQQSCSSVSGDQSNGQDGTSIIQSTSPIPVEADEHKHVSHPNDLTINAKLPYKTHVSGVDESKCLDGGVHHQGKSGERTNLVEVKAALASLELTLGSLTRTKDSIGRATRIAVDCVKFGVAAEVVELLALFLEKESSLYRRVDLFFLVDSIAQCCRGLKGEVGGTYFSAVKDTLSRMLSAAAPSGHAARENRRQCLKVLRLWLERRILPESIICRHIRELDSLNCSSSTGGYSRRMSRTERSFDDPLRDMEGMLVDEYGSNSSLQLPGFCLPRMLKEEEDGSDSDGESFEAVTPEHDSGNLGSHEATTLPATEKHRHILEDVDGELEMEDVAPTCNVEMDRTTATTVDVAPNTSRYEEQLPSFLPPLPHNVQPQAPPLPKSPPPLPPPLPPPPPPPPLPHASTMSHIDVNPQLHVGRNSMPEPMLPRPPAPGIHHPMQMAEPTSSCSYNSYPVMHNPVAPGNNLQPMDANSYGKAYNIRPPYPSPSNQFSYFQPDQQIRPPQREVPPPPPPPPPYYDRPHFGQTVEGGRFYGDQDNVRPPRHEMTDGWGYSRPPYPSSMHSENDKAYPPMYSGPSCGPTRPQNHGWGYPPRPVYQGNHIANGPPCDGAVPVGVRAPGYWQPR